MPNNDDPLAYFITFHCYGAWLHGDERGSVDRNHNVFFEEPLPESLDSELRAGARLRWPPMSLGLRQRDVVAAAIREVAAHRGWHVFALNVRTSHAHVVIAADSAPEKVMSDLKARATRLMVNAGLLPPGRRPWSRHGSTRYVWDEDGLRAVVDYVAEGQGGDIPAMPLAEQAGADPLAHARAAERMVGLCSTRLHARRVQSQRGSVFWLCERAKTDARYRKYPALPVVRCEGFELRPG
jgi:hypothetical protein